MQLSGETMPLRRMEILKSDFDRIKMESLEAQKTRREAHGFFFGERIDKTAKVEDVLHLPYKPPASKTTELQMRQLLLGHKPIVNKFLSETGYEESDYNGYYHSHPNGVLRYSEGDLKLNKFLGDRVHFLYAPPTGYACINCLGEYVEVVVI